MTPAKLLPLTLLVTAARLFAQTAQLAPLPPDGSPAAGFVFDQAANRGKADFIFS